jgi:hypothetical protein
MLLLRLCVLDLEAKWLTVLVPLAWALERRPNSSKTLIRSFVLAWCSSATSTIIVQLLLAPHNFTSCLWSAALSFLSKIEAGSVTNKTRNLPRVGRNPCVLVGLYRAIMIITVHGRVWSFLAKI